MNNQESMVPDEDTEDRDTRMWAMFLHLSFFAGYAVPIFGLLAPVVIWQVKKDELPLIDRHGKNMVNWLISLVIYTIVGVLLCFIVIGVPFLILLGVLSVVFPIVAGIKANNGKVWKYPMSIQFLK